MAKRRYKYESREAAYRDYIPFAAATWPYWARQVPWPSDEWIAIFDGDAETAALAAFNHCDEPLSAILLREPDYALAVVQRYRDSEEFRADVIQFVLRWFAAERFSARPRDRAWRRYCRTLPAAPPELTRRLGDDEIARLLFKIFPEWEYRITQPLRGPYYRTIEEACVTEFGRGCVRRSLCTWLEWHYRIKI